MLLEGYTRQIEKSRGTVVLLSVALQNTFSELKVQNHIYANFSTLGSELNRQLVLAPPYSPEKIQWSFVNSNSLEIRSEFCARTFRTNTSNFRGSIRICKVSYFMLKLHFQVAIHHHSSEKNTSWVILLDTQNQVAVINNVLSIYFVIEVVCILHTQNEKKNLFTVCENGWTIFISMS